MKRKAGFTATHSVALPEEKTVTETPQHPFERIAADMGKLIVEKNATYGSSYALCATFLELLYPGGVNVTRYTDMLLIVRMFDKMMRIARRKDAFGESPYKDLAGYALLGVHKEEGFKKGPENTCPEPGERI